LLILGTILSPLVMLAFAFIHWLPLSLFTLAVSGAAGILVMNLSNALVQTQARNALRGRVMSVYSLIFFGFMPVGSLLVGLLAEALGEPAAMIIFSVLGLLFALGVWLRVPALSKQS
jgi:MFS family permease